MCRALKSFVYHQSFISLLSFASWWTARCWGISFLSQSVIPLSVCHTALGTNHSNYRMPFQILYHPQAALLTPCLSGRYKCQLLFSSSFWHLSWHREGSLPSVYLQWQEKISSWRGVGKIHYPFLHQCLSSSPALWSEQLIEYLFPGIGMRTRGQFWFQPCQELALCRPAADRIMSWASASASVKCGWLLKPHQALRPQTWGGFVSLLPPGFQVRIWCIMVVFVSISYSQEPRRSERVSPGHKMT